MRQGCPKVSSVAGILVATVSVLLANGSRASDATTLKVGVAAVTITPERPIWMAGLGARKKRSEGKYQDLYVKALAIRDARGQTAVILGSDLVAVTANWRGPVLKQVKERFGLEPEQVLINSSHTHCGPVIAKLFYPEWDPEYTAGLITKTVAVIGNALDDLEESSIAIGRGVCSLSVNRRRPLRDDPAHVDPGLLPNPQGLVDHDVNVLKVERKNGTVKAVMFLYACHPTTMGGYLLGGDYAGFAQKALEAAFPGATAVFLQGCGGDLKTRNVGPNGRFKDGPVEVVEGFGRELSQAVLTILAGKLTLVSGRLATREGSQELPVQPLLARQELESRVRAGDWRADKAKRILQALDAKKELPRSHGHIVQVVTIGDTFALVGLSGEACVEYALRLKRELGSETWVAGYTNDVAAYIPSARMIPEGGYEVERWLGAGDIPTPFEPRLEELIVSKVHELVRVSRAASAATP